MTPIKPMVVADEVRHEVLAIAGAMSVFKTFTEGLQIEPDF